MSLNTLKIGIIGLGNMSGAILKGLLKAGVLPENVVGMASSPQRATLRHAEYGVVCTTLEEGTDALSAVDLLILGVKPFVMPAVLADLEGITLKAKAVVVSIAAGTTLATIGKSLPNTAIVRAMPNTPALVGQGFTALSSNAYVDETQKKLAESVFEAVGKAVWLEEGQINAFTGLFGSGPAYVFEVMEALVDAGLAEGLPTSVVEEGVLQLVKGSALLLENRATTASQLKAEVVTPNGTTARGLEVLRSANVAGALVEAVHAATRRAEELSKNV
jgi:pyrroline-5-carboxylate reductase